MIVIILQLEVFPTSDKVSDLVNQIYGDSDNLNDVYDVRYYVDNNSCKVEIIIGHDDFSDPDILKLFTKLLYKCKEFRMKRVDNQSTKYTFTIKDEFVQEV